MRSRTSSGKCAIALLPADSFASPKIDDAQIKAWYERIRTTT